MNELVNMDVETFIKKYRIRYLHENFCRYVFVSTCFGETEDSNALFYLGTLLPIVIPTYVIDYRGAIDRLTAKTKDRIHLDEITKITKTPDGYISVSSSGKKILSTNLVLAAPYHNASKLLDVPKPQLELATPATVIYARGERKAAFKNKELVLCDPVNCGIGLVWKQDSGDDLIFALHKDPDLDFLYKDYTITGRADWKTAVVLSGKNWFPLEIEEGLFLPGDYNLCGVEDSMVTGICTGNMIVERSQK